MAELILERSVRLEMRAQAHHLQAGVLIGEKGLTGAVMKEIDRALTDHGLVKVHVAGDDREERSEIYQSVADTLGAARIQAIGKMLVFYRPTEDEAQNEPAPKSPRRKAQPVADDGHAILMAKADPGARGMKKPVDPTAKKSAKGAKSVKSAKGGKNAKPRVITARKRPKRTTKKAALS